MDKQHGHEINRHENQVKRRFQLSSNDIKENKDRAKKNEVIQKCGGGNVIANIRKNVNTKMKKAKTNGKCTGK